MKTRIKRLIYQIILLASVWTACKQQNVNENSVYLTMAEVNNTARLTVDDAGGSQAITIASSAPTTGLVTAKIAIDTNLIKTYNQQFGTAYSALPAAAYSMSEIEVHIQPGMTLSDAVTFRVLGTELFEVGKTYMVPITIQQASGLPVIEASKTLYLILNQVVVTSAASLSNNFFHVNLSENNNDLRAMQSITMETRVMVNRFQPNNPFISSIMGIEENFLFRFGDVTVQPNQLQVAGGNTATNVNYSFNTGTWYHIAATYDGTQLRVYVDGRLLATTAASRIIDLTSLYQNGFHFGRSANGRPLDGAISEARIWSRVLSQGEINNGRCGVDPSSAGLIGYWKFNDAEGRVVRDISGHGRDAVANQNIQWMSGVRCE